MNVSRGISQADSVYGLGTMVRTFYLIGRNKYHGRSRETGVLAAEAMLDSLIVEGALKGITQCARPLDGVERSEFFDGGSCFPSRSQHAGMGRRNRYRQRVKGSSLGPIHCVRDRKRRQRGSLHRT